ncbi:MAG: peptidylprolyl isomerase [Gemmatimonadota bacterium]
MRFALSFLTALLVGVSVASAQEPATGVSPGPDELFVDRVVAVVGDSAIFYYDLLEELYTLQAQGVVLPEDADERLALEREVLDALVVRTLILRAAQQDTLATVSEDRIEAEFQLAWEQEVQSFGGEAQLQSALATTGRTVAQHRDARRREIQEGLLQQRYVQLRRQEIRVPPVEEAEIRAYIEEEADRIGTRPATVELRQVVLLPEPSDSARAAAREEAERILALVRGGEEFTDLARRFSDDAGTAQRGGEIGWVRQGERIPELEEAMFRMQRGGVSDVVETIFGAHLLRVERVRGPERLVYHILVAADLTEEDLSRARMRAGEIRDSVAAGASILDFEGRGDEVGIPNQIALALDQLSTLPAPYALPLRSSSAGDVVGPLEFTWQGQPVVVVAEVTAVREAGAFTFEELRGQVRDIISQQRFQERLVERLMAETHVETRW